MSWKDDLIHWMNYDVNADLKIAGAFVVIVFFIMMVVVGYTHETRTSQRAGDLSNYCENQVEFNSYSSERCHGMFLKDIRDLLKEKE